MRSNGAGACGSRAAAPERWSRGMVRRFEELGGSGPAQRAGRAHRDAKAAARPGSRRRAGGADGSTRSRRMPTSCTPIATLLRDNPRGGQMTATLRRKRLQHVAVRRLFRAARHRPEIHHHTVLFGPRYRGLIDDIFNRETLAEDFSLYLHAPCVTDPSLAPPGCGSFYVLAPGAASRQGANRLGSRGSAYRDRILDYLEARIIPGLRADLVTSRIFTPFDFRDELNAHHGSAFSLEPILRRAHGSGRIIATI